MALDDGRVFSDFVADVVYKRDITVKGDGSAVRAFCYISDAVEAFFKVLLSGEPRRAYNVGNPNGAMSILELAHLLVSITPKLGLKVRFDARHKSANYIISPINKSVPNISEILKLNWSPNFTPYFGFSRTLKSFGID
jgi:nucleoside-diphosphate-sugar epimerase